MRAFETALKLRFLLGALGQTLNAGCTALLDRVFGFDLFISYTRNDKLELYAIELAKALAEEGLICCVDSEEFETGLSWKMQGRRALRKSSKIVLLASDSVSSSKGIRDELEFNAGLGSPRPISVINIGGGLEKIEEDSPFQRLLRKNRVDLEEQLWIPETSLEVPLLRPSSKVVEKIRSDFKLRRQSTRRRISLATSLLALVLVGGTLLYSFGVYANKARAREILGKVGQTLPANAEDWEALETLASQGSAVRDSALEIALNEHQTSDRLTKRSKAFARAVVGLNARDRSRARRRIMEALRRDTPEVAENGVFLITLAADLEITDPDVTKISTRVWKRAAIRDPDSSMLGELGARVVENLSTNDASTELWSLIGEHASESLSTATVPALTILATKLDGVDRKELRGRLLGDVLQMDENSDAWRHSAKGCQEILSACSKPAPLAWAIELHKTIGEISTERYRLERGLWELLSDAVGQLEAKEAETMALKLMEDFHSGKKYDPEILAKALGRVKDGDQAIDILERTAHGWPIQGLAKDYVPRQVLGDGLESLADQIPSNKVEQVASAILIRLCEASRSFNGDGWEYQAMLGLRRPLARLIPKLASDDRRWLLQAVLSRPELDKPNMAGDRFGLAGVSPRHLRGALIPLLVDLIISAPPDCAEMLHNALVSEGPQYLGNLGESIGEAAKVWSPIQARDFLLRLANDSPESIGSKSAGALAGLVRCSGENSPPGALHAMLKALSILEDSSVNELCQIADAIAIYPSLRPEEAEMVYDRLLRVRESIPGTFSGHLAKSAVSDRMEKLEERLPPIRIQDIFRKLPRTDWPSIGLIRALSQSDLERLWAQLPEMIEARLGGSLRVGDKVTYLGSRVEKLAAMAIRLPRSQMATNLESVIVFIRTHSQEGLATELRPVVLAMADRIANEEAYTVSQRLLSHLRTSITTECRAVIAEVVGTLLRETEKEQLLLILRSPVATDIVEREILGHTRFKSVWQPADAQEFNP